jgi:hypothetical protein
MTPLVPPGRSPPPPPGKKTVRLDAAALAQSGVTPWPLALAALEQLAPWGIQALRLGILSLLSDSIRAMARAGATTDSVARMREYVEALAHLPWEPR